MPPGETITNWPRKRRRVQASGPRAPGSPEWKLVEAVRTRRNAAMISPLRRSLLLLALVSAAPAEVRLPGVFSDGAVLQRDRAVPVWGHAEPGRKVTVKFAGQEKSAQTGPDGRWRVDLDAMPASTENRVLEATEEGGNRVEVKDVLVGEVWLASGQSNMQWNIAASRQEDQEVAKAGPVAHLRLFQVPNKLSAHRLDDVDARWTSADPENSMRFSAVAWFFGRRLVAELGVPVGMMNSSWGGSRIEPWFADEGLAEVPDLADMKQYREARMPGSPAYQEAMRRHLASTRAWLESAERAMHGNRPLPAQPPAPPTLPIGHNQAMGTYQAMIHPLAPYGLRGFLWYQGESNVGEGLQYTLKMQALIHGWRLRFEAPQAPFLFVQLAPYNYGDNRQGALQELWIAQEETLKMPHTGMAATMDIGDPKDIHPRNKSEVGHRLARWALADTYGKADVAKSGPVFGGFEATGDRIRIRFSHTDGGLKTRDGAPPSHFEVASGDWIFHPATAEIDGEDVLLKSDAVPQPEMARFAWSQTAEPNLANGAGLPALPFHTHWPDHPSLGRNVATHRPFTSSDPNGHGWNAGLTDGNWHGAAGTCFATGSADSFPKHVTIDLGRPREVGAARFGVPGFGATKTVAISVSADGRDFQEVGRHEFAGKTEARTDIAFGPRPARYVRATFIDHHERQDQYSEKHGFLSELEVYGKAD